MGKDGVAHKFTAQDQASMVANVIEPMASDGLRTICIAYKDYKEGRLFSLLILLFTVICRLSRVQNQTITFEE